MTKMSEKAVFISKLRNIFWPIYRHELPKFFRTSGMMFCVLFIQNILKTLKDSILISEVSAEVVGFVKLYCVAPVAALLVVVFARMINHKSLAQIYYRLINYFVAFFVIFAFIIYPNVDFFHMSKETADSIVISYPHLKWYVALVGNWSYVMLYTLAELWPNTFYILLFWQMMNDINSPSEAKRFYILISLFGNFAVVLAGFTMRTLSDQGSIINIFDNEHDNKIILVRVSVALIAVFAVLSCWIVKMIDKYEVDHETSAKNRSDNKHIGLIESAKYIAGSRYLWLMLVCSAAFGFTINLVESVWKSKINELYPTVREYAQFHGTYIMWTGVAIIISTIIGSNIMRRYNWFVAAVIAPAIIGITGTIFFIFVVFDTHVITLFDAALMATPLTMAVYMGAIQNILAKGTKYSLWDTSREMLYIPLDYSLKTKGKAAVDLISSKIGKSASGLVQSAAFTIFPAATFNTVSPYFMVIFIVASIGWVIAVKLIYFEYKKLVD